MVEGGALEVIFREEWMKAALFAVGDACAAVVACRATPGQKAALVGMVQSYVSPTPVTLAVGDGANDVGMIQKAQVGVGIRGLEGQQAVNASDFAVAQFRFLKRLLLVHGRWNYRRMAVVVLYSFYKNFVLVITLFAFGFRSGFSGSVLYEQWLYALYNFFTTLPAIGIGIFEKDVPADYALRHPQLYAVGRENRDMDVRSVVTWVLTAIAHGIIVFLVPVGAYDAPGDGGEGQGFFVFSTTVYFTLVWAMNVRILEHTRTIVYFSWDSLRSLAGKAGRAEWCSNLSGWSVSLWVFSMFLMFFTFLVYSTPAFSYFFNNGVFLNVGTTVLARGAPGSSRSSCPPCACSPTASRHGAYASSSARPRTWSPSSTRGCAPAPRRRRACRAAPAAPSACTTASCRSGPSACATRRSPGSRPRASSRAGTCRRERGWGEGREGGVLRAGGGGRSRGWCEVR